MRSNAEFLVELPVDLLVLRRVVVGLATTGILVGCGLGAARKSTARSGFGRSRGFGRRWAIIHFWGLLVCFEGLRGDMYAMRVCKKRNRLRGCVWDGEIDESEIEGRKI